MVFVLSCRARGKPRYSFFTVDRGRQLRMLGLVGLFTDLFTMASSNGYKQTLIRSSLCCMFIVHAGLQCHYSGVLQEVQLGTVSVLATMEVDDHAIRCSRFCPWLAGASSRVDKVIQAMTIFMLLMRLMRGIEVFLT